VDKNACACPNLSSDRSAVAVICADLLDIDGNAPERKPRSSTTLTSRGRSLPGGQSSCSTKGRTQWA
jgi:hypothetical protein